MLRSSSNSSVLAAPLAPYGDPAPRPRHLQRRVAPRARVAPWGARVAPSGARVADQGARVASRGLRVVDAGQRGAAGSVRIISSGDDSMTSRRRDGDPGGATRPPGNATRHPDDATRAPQNATDRKSTRLNSSHVTI